MSAFYTEYLNENKLRSYPFEDNTTGKTTDGYELPKDYIIDAMVYLLGSSNPPYISEINLITNSEQFKVADSVTKEIIATGTITESESVILYDDLQRRVGIIILGEGRYRIQDGKVHLFSPAATKLAVASWAVVDQVGLQGFLLDDGTLITGGVTFEGRNGLLIDSYVLTTSAYTSRNVIQFSAVGTIPTIETEGGEDCIGGSVPIKCLRLITTQGSKITASEYEPDTIALSPRGFTQETLCPDKNIAKPIINADGSEEIRTKRDICKPPLPLVPEPEQPDPSVIVNDVTMCVSDGRLVVVTPSTPYMSNPLKFNRLENMITPKGSLNPTDRFVNNIQKTRAESKFAGGGDVSFNLAIKGLNP